jgi:Flp pilus assembly pilin Flp
MIHQNRVDSGTDTVLVQRDGALTGEGGAEPPGASRDERGMTTAEYALGTVATVSFVGVIISILQNADFRAALWGILEKLFSFIANFISG